MIKIIKEGTKRTVTCDKCGCLFSFEDEDTKKVSMADGCCEFIGYKVSVVCPQCKHENVLKQPR